MNMIRRSIIPFFREFWWAWLTLSLICLFLILLGPSVVGTFIAKVASVLFTMIVIGSVLYYTIGGGIIGMWAVMRFAGFVGLFFAINKLTSQLEDSSFSELMKLQSTDVNRDIFQFTILLSIASLFMIAIGELLLYLHKLDYKSKNLQEFEQANYQILQKLSKECLCPRCVGKGWVDQSDIERLGMTDKEPGRCIYCEGNGYVERGHTNNYDPRENEEYHEKMEEKRQKVWQGREEEKASLEKEFEEFKKQYEKKLNKDESNS